jgi:hypothetical protein
LLLFTLRESHADSATNQEEWPLISSLPSAQYNLFRLFSSGLSDVFWSHTDFSDIKIGKECTKSMAITADHLEEGSEWAFRGKNSSMLLD